MDMIDLRTLNLSLLAVAVLCMLLIGFLWWQHRKRYDGLSFWLASFILQLSAILLIELRSLVPDWLSIVLANTLAIAGLLLEYVGLGRFVGRSGRQWHNCALLLIFALVHYYFSMVRPNLTMRDLNVSTGMFLLSFQCLWLLLRHMNRDLRRYTHGVGFIFAFFCLVNLARILLMLVKPLTTNDYFKSGFYSVLVVMAYQLTFILLTFGLFLLVNGRLRSELRAHEEKYSKAFHSSPYAVILSRLSDGRILEVNEGFSAITGYQPDEVTGKTSLEIHFWANEDDRTVVANELKQGRSVREKEFLFHRKSGELGTALFSAEVLIIQGEPWLLSNINDITRRKQSEEELLQAFKEIKTLRGIIPICMHCKKIRDDQGYWNQVEVYVRKHTEAEFSHGICPECCTQLYPWMQKKAGVRLENPGDLS